MALDTPTVAAAAPNTGVAEEIVQGANISPKVTAPAVAPAEDHPAAAEVPLLLAQTHTVPVQVGNLGDIVTIIM